MWPFKRKPQPTADAFGTTYTCITPPPTHYWENHGWRVSRSGDSIYIFSPEGSVIATNKYQYKWLWNILLFNCEHLRDQ